MPLKTVAPNQKKRVQREKPKSATSSATVFFFLQKQLVFKGKNDFSVIVDRI